MLNHTNAATKTKTKTKTKPTFAAMTATTKEAVVFLLDSNESMNTPYSSSSSSSSSSTTPSTRLECAKDALILWISNLMILSKQHEVAVVVLKTKETRHYLNHTHFPNLTLLPWSSTANTNEKNHDAMDDDDDDDDDENPRQTKDIPNRTLQNTDLCMTRPTVSLLHDIDQIQTAPSSSSSSSPLRGDFLDGLVLAADVMRRRTFGKSSYQRRSIVLLTDAVHHVNLNYDHDDDDDDDDNDETRTTKNNTSTSPSETTLRVVDSLREMNCEFHVLGLDFVHPSTVFTTMLPESESAAVKQEQQQDEQQNMSHNHDENDNVSSSSSSSSTAMNDDDSDDDDDNESHEDPKLNRERFLLSVARLTGGSVCAVHSIQDLWSQGSFGKRIPKSTRRKVALYMLPPNAASPIQVRVSLLLSKTNLPSLKKEAILIQEDEEEENDNQKRMTTTTTTTTTSTKPWTDGLGNYVTSELQTFTDHYDATNKQVRVEETERTKAIRYGSDYIPLGDFDIQGLQQQHQHQPQHNDATTSSVQPMLSTSMENDITSSNETTHTTHAPTSGVRITILGYRSTIHRAYLIGPPYVISGEDSVRSSTALSAMAQALHRLNQCAIGTYVKSTAATADPQLIALFPYVVPSNHCLDDEYDKSTKNKKDCNIVPHQLVLFQLPFCGDVQKLHTIPNIMSSTTTTTTTTTRSMTQQSRDDPQRKDKICDDLITALTLPNGVLESTQIPNPALRSFRKTLVYRAIHSNHPNHHDHDIATTTTSTTNTNKKNESQKEIISARGDWFQLPTDIQMAAMDPMKRFRETFPIVPKNNKNKR